MRYRYILFDLDGTLTDSAPGITKSVQYALSSFGIEENDMSKLLKFVGPPLTDAFKEYGDFSEAEIEQIIIKYRERFSKIGIFENSLYDGIPEFLKLLKDKGLELIVATSKPYKFTEIILNHFDIKKYFNTVCGSTFDGTVSTKGDVIKLALETAGIKDKSLSVMIGDRHYDVDGARENGISCIGVTYGYGSREELLTAGAIDTADNLNELKNLLI